MSTEWVFFGDHSTSTFRHDMQPLLIMLEFQLLDVEVFDECTSDSRPHCVATCYGYAEDGQTVAVRVQGFRPHVYWKIESGNDSVILNTLQKVFRDDDFQFTVEYKRNLRYFECDADGKPMNHMMIKVSTSTVRGFYKLRRDETYNRAFNALNNQHVCMQLRSNIAYVHDSRVSLPTMFMADANITPCQWVKVKQFDNRTVPYSTDSNERVTRSAIEAVAQMDDLVQFDKTDVPLPIVCYDIEVATNHRIRLGVPGQDSSCFSVQPGTQWAITEQLLIDRMQAMIDEDYKLSQTLNVQAFATCNCSELLYDKTVVTGVYMALPIEKDDDPNIDGNYVCVKLPNGEKASGFTPNQLTSHRQIQNFVESVAGPKASGDWFKQSNNIAGESKLHLADNTLHLRWQTTTVLRDRFPTSELDPIACIGVVVYHYNTDRQEERILTAAECAPIPGATVDSFACEADMLLGFSKLIQNASAFLILGYNNCNFDSKYIADRLALVGTAAQQTEFYENLGQRVDYECGKTKKPQLKQTNLTSSAYGDNEFHYLHNMSNCIEGDIYMFVKQQFKMENYSLKSVCSSRLGDVNKDDVSYHDINYQWGKSPAMTARIAQYCLQDCRVLTLLDSSMKMIATLLATSRATSTLMRDLWFRGQEIRIDTLLYTACVQHNIVKTSPSPNDIDCDKSFQGATVLEPRRGFYKQSAVAVLDFASLYPSIMQAHNMCFSTVVKPNYICSAAVLPGKQVSLVLCSDSNLQASQVTPEIQESRMVRKVIQSFHSGTTTITFDDSMTLRKLSSGCLELQGPNGRVCGVHSVLPTSVSTDTIDETVFVQSSAGIIPTVLRNVLGLRKRFREEIKQLKATQPESITRQRLVDALDARQLAAKVICNSVFGYTSANRYPMFAIASAITAKGRQMIDVTKSKAEEQSFPVVYGDTDSVFVQLDNDEHTFARAHSLAESITQVFPPPNVLEFEKVYTNFLLINRKQYAGVKQETQDGCKKLEAKGIASARRDVPQCCKSLQQDLFKIHMFDETGGRSAEEATKLLLTQRIDRLCSFDIPIEELQMSRSLKRDSEYKNLAQPQLYVKDLKNTRCPGSGPSPGERVSFVYMKPKCSTAKRFECAEDPEYVVANGLQSNIDVDYYIDRMETVSNCFGDYLKSLRNTIFDSARGRLSAKRQKIRPLTDFF